MNTNFGKVAVLMGGNSSEREISLISGQAILNSLLRSGVDAVGIDTVKGVSQLLASHFDRVFIALHGRGGEDGTMQGLLEILGRPYTGSGVLGSALAMDKYRTKQVWRSLGLPTPDSTLLTAHSNFSEVVAQLRLPIMVKPALEGSSVGITKVTHLDQLQPAWQQAHQYGVQVLAERYITGKEYTAAILGDQLLPLIRLETPRDFYDYQAKYRDTDTAYLCPCGLTASAEQTLQNLARQAFLAINGHGWGRVDFKCDETGSPWLLEVNTVPGMTDHSLVPMAAKAAGINFDELVLRILATAESPGLKAESRQRGK
jgi:D-alanine-D-alanine ligase